MARKQPWIYPGNGRLTTSGAALSATDMPDLEDQNDFHLVSQIMAVRDLAMALQALIGPNGENLGGTYSGAWNHLDSTLPTGVAGSAMQALWKFNNDGSDLTDRSGNNPSWSVNSPYTGAPKHGAKDGLVGMWFNNSMYLSIGSPAVGMFMTGELTIEIQALMNSFSGVNQTLLMMGGASKPSQNYLYALYIQSSFQRVWYFCENATGNDVSNIFETPYIHSSINMLTLTRDSDGDVFLYQDGVKVNEASLASPASGASGDLYMGNDPSAVNYEFEGLIFSCRICNVMFSDAQVLESYQRVRRDA